MAEARRDEKRVLLEVGGNWCGWCREFERFVRADTSLGEALRCAFVVVRVNVSPENSNARFLSAYPDAPGYPYFFVLDDAGSLLACVDTDAFLKGESYDRGKLLAFIRKWEPDRQSPRCSVFGLPFRNGEPRTEHAGNSYSGSILFIRVSMSAASCVRPARRASAAMRWSRKRPSPQASKRGFAESASATARIEASAAARRVAPERDLGVELIDVGLHEEVEVARLELGELRACASSSVRLARAAQVRASSVLPIARSVSPSTTAATACVAGVRVGVCRARETARASSSRPRRR